MSVTNENKIIAQTALNVFGGKPKVFKYWDHEHRNSVDILSCTDRPCEGVTSYSTIGLSEHSIGYKAAGLPLCIEIVGACASDIENYPNVLADCALRIITFNIKCHPGSIIKNAIDLSNIKSEMKHILLTTPFVWEKSPETIDFPDKKVTWLNAVPISQTELEYSEDEGTEALEELFEKHQIDIFNLSRKSVK